MGAFGALIFLALPLLVGLMVEQRGLTGQRAGTMASVYFATYFLASGSAFLWLHRVSAKIIGAIAYLLMACGLATGAADNSTMALGCGFALAGLGGGLLFSLAVDIIAGGRNSDKNFGWLLATQQLLAASFLYLTPGLSLEAVLLAVAGLCLLMLPGLLWLDRPPRTQQISTTAKQGPNGDSRMALSALAINFMALSALWAFVERIGSESGLESGELGFALSLSMLGGLTGALLVALVGERWGRQLPLWSCGALFIGLCMAYRLDLNLGLYVVLTCALSFAWNVVLAYQMGVIAALDTTGTQASLIPAAQGAGAMLGPSLGGWLITGAGYSQLLTVVAGLVLLSIAAFSALALRASQVDNH